MAGAAKMACFCAGVGKHAAGEAAVVRRDTGCDGGVCGVDADGVGGAVGVCVVGDHLREVQGCGARDRERRADVA